MNINDVVEGLKDEARANQVSNITLGVFASRKRTRNIINLTSLYNKMKKAGHNYSKDDYIPLIRRLDALGLGSLDIDAKGKIRGLKSIKITLQSIGAAARGNGKLKEFNQKNKFETIETSKTSTSLNLTINDKIRVSLSDLITDAELFNIISKLRSI